MANIVQHRHNLYITFDCMAALSLAQRFSLAFRQQITKYRQLGYGKYLALLTFVMYFTLGLEVLKLIWPYIYGLIPDTHLYFLTINLVNIAISLLYNGVMYFIYTRKIPFLQQYRVEKNTPWPWESDPEKWRQTLKKTYKALAINILIITPLLTIISLKMNFTIKMDMQSIPDLKTIIWQFSLFLLVEEILFYAVHRILHHPKLYWIHKHHHEYNITITLAAQYAHPLEHLLANTLPGGLGWLQLSKVYPVHIFTIIIWLSFRVIEGLDGHCGYNWPWGQSQIFPFSAGGAYHYFHHKQNVGNYGAILNILDTTFGTNEEYNKFDAQKRKKSK